MKNCIICGQKTKGSIGAAHIRHKNICQPCKDKEDKALIDRVKHEGKLFNKLVDELERGK